MLPRSFELICDLIYAATICSTNLDKKLSQQTGRQFWKSSLDIGHFDNRFNYDIFFLKILENLYFGVLHVLDTILVHCILHVLGTILVHCLIWALCLYIVIKDNCVVGSFCVLTFKVRELLTFVF